MLDLNSDRWIQLQSASGHSRVVPDLIQSLSKRYNQNDWDEVWQQISHQQTLYPAAYAAFPHLLRLGRTHGIQSSADFLYSCGYIAAPFECVEPTPDDLAAEFNEALRVAGEIALAAARQTTYSTEDYPCVLFAAGALNGHTAHASKIASCLFDSSAELTCPACNAYLCGDFEEENLYFRCPENNSFPIGDLAQAIPRTYVHSDNPKDAFGWFASLCVEAKQSHTLSKLCCLYGCTKCPKCEIKISIMERMLAH